MIALSRHYFLSPCFPLSISPFLLSMATWRPSHEQTLCVQKPFVWPGRRTDPIMSEGQEVKKSLVASCFLLREMVRMEATEGKKKTEEIILRVNIA